MAVGPIPPSADKFSATSAAAGAVLASPVPPDHEPDLPVTSQCDESSMALIEARVMVWLRSFEQEMRQELDRSSRNTNR